MEIDNAHVGTERESSRLASVPLFIAAAYITLFADAYLVLASLASRMMKASHSSYLIPFSKESKAETHLCVLIVVTWTAILALGCLSSRHQTSQGKHSTAVVWFVLVIAMGPLSFLPGILKTVLNWVQQLFLYGL